MFESTSKFPKFYLYMQLIIAITIFIGMFFSLTLVSVVYFVALMLSAVVLILDKKYGTILTNYKLTYFLFDLINLIAVIAIVYYENKTNTRELNMFLVALIVSNVVLMIADIFLVKNKNLTKMENLWIDVVKLCSMICLLTYFFKVSELVYAIVAFGFELINLALKIYVNRAVIKPHTENKEENERNAIVSLLRSSSDEEEID